MFLTEGTFGIYRGGSCVFFFMMFFWDFILLCVLSLKDVKLLISKSLMLPLDLDRLPKIGGASVLPTLLSSFSVFMY